jgi:MoaA/NifB/PqqE/SkfB family radical SAM enzyme
MRTTVITSGLSKNIYSKLETLYDCNLRSLTTSYDMVSLDSSSDTKSNLALKTIDMFRSFGPVRDVAVVATLTKKNYKELPETIKKMSDNNIWTFFDLIHADRGQPGSKVKNTNLDLMFSPDDFKRLFDVLHFVLHLKKDGYLCHASEIFINKIIEQQSNVYTWNCAKEDNFPAWVTVDCDGTVYPCDDFNFPMDEFFPVWQIYDKWKEFSSVWQKNILDKCPGCCWNTHIDAHAIKRNELPLTDYIHGTEGL